jgi:hypothetical protein
MSLKVAAIILAVSGAMALMAGVVGPPSLAELGASRRKHCSSAIG